MSMSVGASTSSALSYLQSLLQQDNAKDAKKTSASDPLSMLMQAVSGDDASSAQAGSAAKPATGASCPPFSADTMSALISAQGQQSAGGPDAKLFAKLDTDGDGTISKDEFSAAASKAGADSSVADAVFNKIDANGDGSVTQDELTKADQASSGHHHHHHVGGGGGAQSAGGAQDPLEAALSDASASGATTQTSTNADGSTTTTISYADGSKIDLTSAAPASASTGGSSSSSSSTKSNLLEQLIKLQSQVLSAATSTMSAVA